MRPGIVLLLSIWVWSGQVPTYAFVDDHPLSGNANDAFGNDDNGTTPGTTPFSTVAADTTPPPAPIGLTGTPSGWTYINSFSLNWTNPSDPSGIVAAWYKLGSAPGSSSDGVRQTGRPFSVSAIPQGSQAIYVWLEDGAGNKNHNNRSTTTLYYDGAAPTGGAITINNGAVSTSSLIVMINNVGATDGGGSGLSKMCFSNNNTSWSPWEPYTSTRSGWDLSQYGGSAAFGQKTVYALYRDAVGYVSSVVSDDIAYSTNESDYWVYTNGPGVGNSVGSFAVDSKGRLLAGTWTSGGTVWRTSENSNTWTQLGTIPLSDSVMGISVNAKDHIFISVISKGLYRSTDDGASWQLKNSGLTNLRVRGSLVDKKGYVWVASEGGLFRSTNNGDNWAFMIASSKGLVFLDSANTIVTQNASTIYRSTNDGGSWTSIPGTSGVTLEGVHPDGSYFGSSATSAVYRSTNFGTSWVNLNNPIVFTSAISAMTFNARGDIFGTQNGSDAGVIMSTDLGANWTVANTGLPSRKVVPIACLPTGDVFVAPDLFGVYRTRVATQPTPKIPWTFTYTGISHTIIIPTGANPNINGIALTRGDYVGVFYDSSGTLACAGCEPWTGTGNVTLGASTTAKDGLAVGEVLKWKFWRQNDGRVVEARATYQSPGAMGGMVTDTSQYRTNGISAISSLNGNVTSANGKQLPELFVLMQNYPNPFNPSTRIAYELAANVHVRLTVLNMLGQEVAALVDGTQETGYHEVKFDATGLSSGVYFYRLQAGTFVETRKLLLVR
jgi:hypothetical protein